MYTLYNFTYIDEIITAFLFRFQFDDGMCNLVFLAFTYFHFAESVSTRHVAHPLSTGQG